MGAHLLGITGVGDTPYWVWLIVFTSDCCVGSSAQMVVHVLDCRRGFEHLTGCKCAMRGIFDAVYNGAVYNLLFMRYRFLTAKDVWTASRSLVAMEIRFSLSQRIGRYRLFM